MELAPWSQIHPWLVIDGSKEAGNQLVPMTTLYVPPRWLPHSTWVSFLRSSITDDTGWCGVGSRFYLRGCQTTIHDDDVWSTLPGRRPPRACGDGWFDRLHIDFSMHNRCAASPSPRVQSVCHGARWGCFNQPWPRHTTDRFCENPNWCLVSCIFFSKGSVWEVGGGIMMPLVDH